VLGRDLVAINKPPCEVAVAGVKVEPMSPGDQGKGLLQVHPQLFEGARSARMAACHEYAAPAQGAARLLESADIIALSPPLIIDKAQIDQIAQTLREVLARTE